MAGILWAIIGLLLLFWLLGLLFEVGGALINILLVIALVFLVYNLLVGRRTV
jgi:hypothetical protein